MSAVAVKILNRLADEGLGEDRTTDEVRMPQVHTRVENGHSDSHAAPNAGRDSAGDQTPGRAQSQDRLLLFPRHHYGRTPGPSRLLPQRAENRAISPRITSL